MTGPRRHPIAGLPDRPIPLGELNRLLHPSTGFDVRDAVVTELVTRAQQEGSRWTVGLAGMLLPGLRRAAWPLVQGYPGKTPDREAETLTAFLAAVAPRRTTCCRADPLAGEDAIDPEALGETSAEHPASTFGFVTRRSCHDIVDVPFCVAAATGPAMIGLN